MTRVLRVQIVLVVLLIVALGWFAWFLDQLRDDVLINRHINCESQERLVAVVNGDVPLSDTCKYELGH